MDRVDYREEARTFLTGKRYDEFLGYVDSFGKTLSMSDFDPATKEEYKSVVEEYYFHYCRARFLEDEFGNIKRESEKYRALYNKNPRGPKAEQYKTKYNSLIQRLHSIESHHENAKLDMTFVQRDAERAKIAVEDNVARNQSKGKKPTTPQGKKPK